MPFCILLLFLVPGNKYDTEKLQIMQNKIIRFILNLTRRDSIRDKELSKAEFLNVTDRVKKLKINHVFNIKNHNCPHICTNRQMKTTNIVH